MASGSGPTRGRRLPTLCHTWKRRSSGPQLLVSTTVSFHLILHIPFMSIQPTPLSSVRRHQPLLHVPSCRGHDFCVKASAMKYRKRRNYCFEKPKKMCLQYPYLDVVRLSNHIWIDRSCSCDLCLFILFAFDRYMKRIHPGMKGED